VNPEHLTFEEMHAVALAERKAAARRRGLTYDRPLPKALVRKLRKRARKNANLDRPPVKFKNLRNGRFRHHRTIPARVVHEVALP